VIELRAVVLDAPETLSVQDRPDPTPGRGEVLVEIATTGVCGTDVSIFKGKIPVHFPLVLGHEMAGTVVDIGTEVSEHTGIGEHVVIDPTITCGRCYQCLKDQENLCTQGALMGRDTDGALRGRVAVPAANVYVLPRSIPMDVAPLIQVATVCMHGQRTVDILASDTVLIIGLGVTGLLHLQLARARGARSVIGITRSAAKRELAERLGADLTLDPADALLDQRVMEATEGVGPDLVIEAVGTIDTLRSAIELVRVGGTIMLFGTITARATEVPFYDLYYKEVAITNPRASKPEDFPACIDMIESGALRIEPMISNTFDFTDALAAINATQTSGTLKVILQHGSADR
jgi:L-iditol 2-dehydrogenase